VSLVSHEDRSLMSAIERLMNRKVEQRVVPGFEPGAHAPRAAEPQRPSRYQPQRPQHRGQQKTPQRTHAPHGERLSREQEAQLRQARVHLGVGRPR
jgi:hypothetical protein